MRRAGRAAALALLAAVLWAGAACSRPDGRGRAPDSPGDPPRGGRFTFPLRAEPASLDFLSGSDFWTYLPGRLVCDSLVDQDAALRIVPRLASSWEFSNDGRVLTFHLRPGVRFHDGAPLTSRDVLSTYRRVVAPGSRALNWIDAFLPIETVEAPDELTVRVTYRHPYAQALRGWRVPILPGHLYAGPDGEDSALARAPVGSGPFRFLSWEPGRRIVLQANRDYWAGRPALDELVFQIIPSPETTIQALFAGEIDFAQMTPQQWEAHGGTAALGRRFQTLRWLPLFFNYIAWRADGSNPFFAEAAVRRALALALDREGYLRTVLHGYGRVVGSPLPTLEGDLQADAAPRDAEAAVALLEAAGWRVDPRTGLRSRDGVPFRFTLLVYKDGEDHLMFSQVAQENLRAIGVDMQVQRLDWNALLSRLQSGAFQAAISGTVLGAPDPDTGYPMLHSSQIRGGQNYAAFRDPEVDAWFEAGRRTLDPEARRRLYARIGSRLREAEPYTVLFTPLTQAAVSRRFRGIRASPRGILDHFPGAAAMALDEGQGP
jgi:peptide/nickel transport system substrate-binding protein